MQVVTIKAKPKAVFGAILALTGLVVILLTFTSNHLGREVDAKTSVSCKTAEERKAYITALGYEIAGDEEKKSVTIPAEFNKIYSDYNDIQKQQGFDLEKYKGKAAEIYTYKIADYKGNKNVIANLIVCEGELIGADLCDPSADSGFLIALEK